MSCVLEILFWTFSLFGIFCALKMVCDYFLICKSKCLRSEIVIKFKNDEDTIENTVRILAEEIFFSSKDKLFSSLTAIDCGSTDSTRDILLKLKKEYPFLKIEN